MKTKAIILMSVLFITSLLLSSCAPQATPVPAAPAITQIVQTQIVQTQIVQGQTIEKIVTATPGPAKEPIKIGVSLDITGPGGITGAAEIDGVKMAAQEINANGGLLGGRPVQLYVQDDKCSPDEGVGAMNYILFQDKISAIVGGGCSSVVLATMDLVKQAQIPFVVGIASNATITQKTGVGGNPWVFRINLTDAMYAAVGGPLLVNKLGFHKFSALVSDDDFGRGALDNFKKAITAAGGQFISEDFFKATDRDFTPILTKINNLHPDSLLIAMQSDDALRLVQQYKELGLKIPISGRASIFNNNVATQIGYANIETASSLDPWYSFDPRPISQEFVKRYEEANGYQPIWQTVLSYEAMMVVADAITRAGSDDPKLIRDAIATTNLTDTIIGQIKFNDYNQNLGTAHMAEIVNGKLIEVGSGNVQQ